MCLYVLVNILELWKMQNIYSFVNGFYDQKLVLCPYYHTNHTPLQHRELSECGNKLHYDAMTVRVDAAPRCVCIESSFVIVQLQWR